MVVVYLIFEKMLRMFLLFLYILSLINILLFSMLIVWYILRNKWYSNDIIFNISDMEYLFKWLI